VPIAITGAADNNLITSNLLIDNNSDGIRFADAASSGNQITNNQVIGSGDDGVKLSGANITFTSNTVSGNQRISGGAAAVEVASVSGTSLVANNTISNDGAHGSEGGIWILGSSGVTVADNSVSGLSGSGIAIDAASSSITLTRNAVYNNGRLGIDLMPSGPVDPANGVTANDAGDADAGANGLLNFPVLGSAVVNSTAQTTVDGTLDGLAAVSSYRIELFASASADASGHGEGQRYLGFVDVTTDGAGHATFNVALAATVAAGDSISATATDLTTHETSEFSACITATNSAPVLDAGSSPTLVTINEDAGAPVGAVGTLVSSLVDFAVPAGQLDNVTDADSVALLGIAVTGADTSHGAWWISTDNGTSWSALGSVSDASARLLAADGSTRIYFEPNADYNGTQASAITLRAWDRTSGSNGGIADTTVNGGMTAFSVTTDTASLTVNAVNDAPVLTGLSLTVSEGQTVTLSGADIGVTDVDSASFTYTVSGLSGGIFQLSSAPGVSIVGFTSAQLGGGQVQFVDDGNEVAPAFSLTASDGSASSNTLSASITYTAVNDAPVLANTPLTLTVAEDAGAPAGAVGSLVGAFTGGISDADIGAVRGIAITASDETNGTWYYSTNAGASWNAVGAVSNASALLLADDGNTRLYFAPAADYTGPSGAALTLRAWDRSSGVAGTKVDTSTNGGTTAFSSATDVVDVTVTAVNDAPVITSDGGGASAALSVAENTTAVTTVTATDVDTGSTLTYSIAGGADAARFTINPSTGALSFVGVPDFEAPTDAGANNVYDVVVQVSDGTLTDTQAIAATVTAVNDNAPAITSDGGGANASVNVPENTTGVTTVTATDADAGSTLTYSIAGGADAARFAINPSTGVLTFVVAPDFEAPSDAGANNVYNVIVQVGDGTLTDSQAIAVTVTAVNDNAPAITSNGGGANASVNVAENTTMVTTVTATDADAGSTLTYAIVGGADAARFTINPSTGALVFVAPPNFEAPADAGGDNVYDVTVQVSDGTLTDTQAIAVSVVNANEAPVNTVPGAQTVAEDGTLAIGVSVTDPDGNVATVRLTVVQGNVSVNLAGGASISAGANGSATLTLSGTTGQINAALATLAYAPNTNYNGSDTLGVVSTDALGLADSDTVAITVSAVNDAPALTSVDLSVGEGQTITLSPIDIGIADVDSAAFTYTVSGLSGGSFQLSGAPGVAITSFTSAQLSSGVVQFADDGDEVAPAFSLTASDGSASSNTLAANVTYTPANDTPVLAGATLTVGEGQAVTLAPANFNVGDPDNNAFTFTLSGQSGGIFQLSSAPGVAITSFTTAQLSAGLVQFVDDGDQLAPAFSVTANDGAANSNTLAATITFIGANDAPVFTSFGGAASATVAQLENQTAAASLSATDADGDVLTFSIVGGADAARFAINGTTGTLTFSTPPDFDAPADAGADNGYDVTVQVSDGAQAAVQAIRVNVGNVNEAPTGLQLTGGSVVERSTDGTVVATVRAIDPDAGDLFSFSLLSDANGRFAIDPASGQLRVADAAGLDYANGSQHTVIVQVTDAGGLSHQQAVVVQVMPIVKQLDLPVPTPPSPPAVAPTTSIEVTTAAPIATASAPASTAPGMLTLRGGGASVPELEATPVRIAFVDDAADGAHGPRGLERALRLRDGADGTSFTLSFALSPEELQAQSAATDDSSLQRSVDALLKQSFGFARGSAQVDEPPAEAREPSATESILRVVTDPVKVSSMAFTAGFVWWLTRGGGLLATMLMGIPAWRHIDLAPVLARRLDDDEEDDHELDLLATDSEPSQLDALSQVKLRSLVADPSLQSLPGEFDGAAADLFQPRDARAPAGEP
jgi:parallel beta-helix repeat protein